jgi:hypothetical protein
MLSILLRRPIDPLVGTGEGYLSTSSSYEEEEKKRGRCRGGSIYRREEALRARDLVSTNSTRISYKIGLIAYQNTGCLCHYSGYCSGRDALNS